MAPVRAARPHGLALVVSLALLVGGAAGGLPGAGPPPAAAQKAKPTRSVSFYFDDVARTGRLLSAYSRTIERAEGAAGRATPPLRTALRRRTDAFFGQLVKMRGYRVNALVVERQRRRLVGPPGLRVVRAMRRLNTAVGRGNRSTIASARANLVDRVEEWQPTQL